jgi:multisubunit Na+/H+ antiporter MnhG subunit
MSHVATLLQIVGVVGVVLSLAVWSPVVAGVAGSLLLILVGVAVEGSAEVEDGDG